MRNHATRQSVESIKRLLIYVVLEHGEVQPTFGDAEGLLRERIPMESDQPTRKERDAPSGQDMELESPERQKVDKEMSPKILNKWKQMTTAMQFVQMEKFTGLCRKCQRDPRNIALMVEALIPV